MRPYLYMRQGTCDSSTCFARSFENSKDKNVKDEHLLILNACTNLINKILIFTVYYNIQYVEYKLKYFNVEPSNQADQSEHYVNNYR